MNKKQSLFPIVRFPREWLAGITAFLWVGISAAAPTAHAGLKRRVAVVDMTMTATPAGAPGSGGHAFPPPSDFAVGLTEMLTTELVQTGKFLVLERKGLADIAMEQDLVTGGRVNPETGAKTGAVIGAQALVRCAITEYSYTQSGSTGSIKVIKGFSLGGNSVKAVVGIDTRIYDATTSEVLASVLAHGTASSGGMDVSYTDANVSVGGSEFKSTPLGKASREAIDQAVQFIVAKLGDVPWEARVIRADTLIYLNAGEESGVAVGQIFTVFRPGEALVDPASGVNLGAPETPIGTIKITAVKPKFSVAQLTQGETPQRDDIARAAKSTGD
jgi:curli biogenesis system outer membrane secretion channel CsgG